MFILIFLYLKYWQLAKVEKENKDNGLHALCYACKPCAMCVYVDIKGVTKKDIILRTIKINYIEPIE